MKWWAFAALGGIILAIWARHKWIANVIKDDFVSERWIRDQIGGGRR